MMTGKQSLLQRVRNVEQALAESGLEAGPPHTCSYFTDRTARSLAFVAPKLDAGIYHSLMDLNFRRCGTMFYRPECGHCEQCQNIRVLVNEFTPTRAQRRCWKRNEDMTVSVGTPQATKEKFRLYERYQQSRHNRDGGESWQEFCDFLYDSPIHTIEVVFRRHGDLVGVGIADVEPDAISAVYCYFDPTATARSVGVFNVLWLIEQCRREHMPHLYLGYYVQDCRKMNYKIGFRPCELLERSGRWRRVERAQSHDTSTNA